MAGEHTYDLLVYHDMTDTRDSPIPHVGESAEARFGAQYKDQFIVAVGPGIHEGRTTVVVAHGHRPMEEVQALLDLPRG